MKLRQINSVCTSYQTETCEYLFRTWCTAAISHRRISARLSNRRKTFQRRVHRTRLDLFKIKTRRCTYKLLEFFPLSSLERKLPFNWPCRRNFPNLKRYLKTFQSPTGKFRNFGKLKTRVRPIKKKKKRLHSSFDFNRSSLRVITYWFNRSPMLSDVYDIILQRADTWPYRVLNAV